MEANLEKKPRRPSRNIFSHLDVVLEKRGYERSKAKGPHYWCFKVSATFPMYLWNGALGKNKLFIDGEFSELAQVLGKLKGVIGSKEGLTKNHKFEAFIAKKVNPHTGVTEYEGWRFQFANESAANDFLDLCEEYAQNGTEAAKVKAKGFDQIPARTTSRTSVIASRVGQYDFRKDLLRIWKSCAVTGCKVPAALRASHIKPWAACDSRERLDSMNGLLLVASLDALFDVGLISFEDNGALLISPWLPPEEWPVLGLAPGMRLRKVNSAHAPYVAYHRERIYKK
jgi:HNH endonuclease